MTKVFLISTTLCALAFVLSVNADPVSERAPWAKSKYAERDLESRSSKATEAKTKPVDPWWDLNGTTAGAGTTPNGIWSTSVANWNANSAGTGALSAWTNGNAAVFSAGTDATGSYTVTVSGSVTASSITFEEGTVALAGTSTPVLTISGVGGITIASTINGTTTLGSTLGNVVLSASQNWANNSSQAFNINSGVVATGSRTLTLNGSGSGGATFNGVLGNGTGTLALTVNTTGGVTTLANANTYTGATTISTGTVVVKNNTSLGTTAGSTSVASGASIQIDGSGLNIAEAINTLDGDGGGGGALRNLANNNTWSGAITIDDTGGRINSDAGLLTLSGAIGELQNAAKNLTIGGAGDVTISGQITGGGDLSIVKDGSGTLTLSGGSANTEVSTTVNAGTLKLSKTAGVNAVGGVLIIGDGTGTDTVQLTAANQIANTSAVTINSSGVLDLNGNSDTISTLDMTAGSVTTGAGTLTLGGNVTGNANAASATISGNLALGANRTFTIANGAAAEDMAISAIISGGFTVTKGGTGTLVFSGANNYTGSTTVSSGILNIRNNTALGTTTAGTTVDTGTALELQGGIAVGAESLSLDGTGISNGGGLRNISGNNSWAGTITINSTTRINSDSGTLTLDVASGNAITGSNDNLQVGGAGHVTINDAIATGTATLTKDGAGTLTLSAANTYTGATAVNAGTLLANNTSGSGTGTGAVTVNNSGTVLGGTGTISGAVTVNANAKLQGGNGTTGTTLTLAGNLTLADNSVIQLALGPGHTHSTLARSGSNTWTFDSNQAFTFTGTGATTGTYQNIITGIANPPSEGSWTITNAGFTGSFVYDGANIDLTLTAVPEPSTWIGGALTVCVLGWSQRKRFARLVRPTA